MNSLDMAQNVFSEVTVTFDRRNQFILESIGQVDICAKFEFPQGLLERAQQ